MSLVNKMLRDLDARRAGDGERAVLPAAVTPLAARREPSRIQPWMWPGVVLTLGVLGALAWFSTQGDVTNMPAPVVVAAAPKLSPAPTAAATPSETAPVPALEADASIAPLDPSLPVSEPQSNFATLRMADQLTGLQAPVPVPAPVPAAEPPARETPRTSAPAAAKALPIAVPKPAERSAASESAPQPAAPSTAPKVAAIEPSPVSVPLTSKPPKTPKVPKVVAQPPVSVAKPPIAKAPAKSSIDKQPHLPAPAERAELKYRHGIQANRQGDLEGASKSYRAALEDYPEHAAARQALSALLINSKRFDEAEDLLREGVELAPVRLASTLAWARLKVERMQAPAALELLQKYAASGERSADYQGFFGALLNRAGRTAEAVEHYKAATQLAPDEGRWWAGLGIALDSAGRGQEAREAYRKARSMPGLPADLALHIDRRLH